MKKEINYEVNQDGIIVVKTIISEFYQLDVENGRLIKLKTEEDED